MKKLFRSFWFNLLVIIGLCFVLYFAFFASLSRITKHGEELTVPDINGTIAVEAIKKLEKMGRIRIEKFGPRIIDIDILFFNTEIHNTSSLKLPHPELKNRRFALLPLAEIAPDFIHPVLKKSINELLKECPDTLPVKKYS